jgi:hypothetical protein
VSKSVFVQTFGLTSGIAMVQVGYQFSCALVIADGSVLWYVSLNSCIPCVWMSIHITRVVCSAIV